MEKIEFEGGVRAIFGSANSGKTTLLARLLELAVLRHNCKNVLIVDREYQLRRKWPFPVTYFNSIAPIGKLWRDLPERSIIVIDEFDRRLIESEESRIAGMDLVNLVRPWKIQLWITARRTSRVPRDITSNCRYLHWGKIWEPIDLDYAREYGLNPAVLPRLQPGEFVYQKHY